MTCPVIKIINDSIVEIYEREHPKLCFLIKQMVKRGVTHNDFMNFIVMKFGKQYKSSLTASASITLFEHYKRVEA